MADFIRQLRNDEKRCTFSLVGTLDAELANITSSEIFLIVPKGSRVARIYAVTKEAFAAGSTVTVGVEFGSEAGVVYFTDLPLDTDGVVTISPEGDVSGKYISNNQISHVFNQAAVDSVLGEVQVVIEFTEEPVTAGAYTR